MRDSGTATYKVTFHFALLGESFAETQEAIDEYLRHEVPERFEDAIPSDHMKFYRPKSFKADLVSIEFDTEQEPNQ